MIRIWNNRLSIWLLYIIFIVNIAILILNFVTCFIKFIPLSIWIFLAFFVISKFLSPRIGLLWYQLRGHFIHMICKLFFLIIIALWRRCYIFKLFYLFTSCSIKTSCYQVKIRLKAVTSFCIAKLTVKLFFFLKRTSLNHFSLLSFWNFYGQDLAMKNVLKIIN